MRTEVTPYRVRLRNGRTGVCFAWRYWGRGRIRWYWIRHDDDGTEKAYPLGMIQARIV